MKPLRLPVALALSLLCGLAWAQGGQDPEAWSAAEITNALITLNTGQIELTNTVLDRADERRVRKLARDVRRSHAALNAETYELVGGSDIDPAQTTLSRQLELRMERYRAQLREAPQEELAETYLRQQVSLYYDVLNLIDGQLYPDADSERLTQLVIKTRATVARELSDAGWLRTQLAGAAEGGPPHG
jgi:predicted outer membrane protein